MPQARAELMATRKSVGKSLFTDSVEMLSADRLRTLRDLASSTLLKENDGLRVVLYQVPPGQKLTGPDPASGDGQFWIVTAGSGCAGPDNKAALDIGKMSCIFIEPDEISNAVTASNEGMELVLMQFPKK